MSVLICAFAVLGQSPSPTRRAIWVAYRLTNGCYERRDFKMLQTTVLPTFYATDSTGKKISHEAIEAYLAKRFAIQEECARYERADNILVHLNQASARFSCVDEFVVTRPKTGRVLIVERSSGASNWVKAATGWKQEHIAIEKSARREFKVSAGWHIPKGEWNAPRF